jgi:hypothetical protein
MKTSQTFVKDGTLFQIEMEPDRRLALWVKKPNGQWVPRLTGEWNGVNVIWDKQFCPEYSLRDYCNVVCSDMQSDKLTWIG